jgi:hypothetical protein
MCLSIDIDEASPSEDEMAAQRALRGSHRAVNEQNGPQQPLLRPEGCITFFSLTFC